MTYFLSLALALWDEALALALLVVLGLESLALTLDYLFC